MKIAGGLFQIVMPQQNLDGVQVGTCFQHVRGEAVAEHVGIYLFLNPRTTGSILAGMAWGFRIDGLITAVPAVPRKEPNGSSAQTPPMCAEFVE
jgi:hypothetical protein